MKTRKEKLIRIPNQWGEYDTVKADFIGAGSFCKCYRVGNRVYSFLRIENNTDLSKEAISLFASGANIPEIEKEGCNEDDTRLIFSMPFYSPLTRQNIQAWNQFQIMRKIWKENRRGLDEMGYNYNVRLIELFQAANIHESITESLTSINDACSNYGLEYTFELALRNTKVNQDGDLIFLDVIFNSEALTSFNKLVRG
jgi:hypothetical protein